VVCCSLMAVRGRNLIAFLLTVSRLVAIADDSRTSEDRRKVAGRYRWQARAEFDVIAGSTLASAVTAGVWRTRRKRHALAGGH